MKNTQNIKEALVLITEEVINIYRTQKPSWLRELKVGFKSLQAARLNGSKTICPIVYLTESFTQSFI